jgi:hypothetical protein
MVRISGKVVEGSVGYGVGARKSVAYGKKAHEGWRRREHTARAIAEGVTAGPCKESKVHSWQCIYPFRHGTAQPTLYGVMQPPCFHWFVVGPRRFTPLCAADYPHAAAKCSSRGCGFPFLIMLIPSPGPLHTHTGNR